MRVAIFESIVTTAGHEHDFDKMLVSELTAAGHQVEFIVPQSYPFKLDYKVPVRYLPGEAVDYTDTSGLAKMLLAAKREWRRRNWFNALYEYAKTEKPDVIIIPTASYRFLRTIRHSRLKMTPVPVIPILHGLTPSAADKVFRQAQYLAAYPQIKLAVINIDEELFGRRFPNLFCVKPPVYLPNDDLADIPPLNDIPVLGFFGQYRREKNLDGFLSVFCQCRFSHPVQLLVQGATVTTEDAADFERIQQKYAHVTNIKFLHKALIGEEWQRAIIGVDALIMPYAAERYRYQPSAMLFTAIGFHKAVVLADSINPEVLAHYRIGLAFHPEREGDLKAVLEEFVNTYSAQKQQYQAELNRANADFSPTCLVQSILSVPD